MDIFSLLFSPYEVTMKNFHCHRRWFDCILFWTYSSSEASAEIDLNSKDKQGLNIRLPFLKALC